MPTYLCLSATLITSRYHAEEWPPSPARAFQALLAGVMTGGYRANRLAMETALAWLETLSAPEIVACPFQPQTSYRLAVPNNDFDVVAREWAKGKPGEPGRIRTLKTVTPKLLPGSGPHVRYLWNVADRPQEEVQRHADLLDTASRCLHTLGCGIDMAFAGVSLIDKLDFLHVDHWQVASAGEIRTVPIPGFLADLQNCYERFLNRTKGSGVDPNVRPTTVGNEYYQRKGLHRRPMTVFQLMRRADAETDEVYSRGAHESMCVAAWLRHATAEGLRPHLSEKEINEFVLGHVESGDRSHRLSFVPLPSIGHKNVDGRIRRVAVVEPRQSNNELGQLLRRVLSGWGLTHPKDVVPICFLTTAEPGDPIVERYRNYARTWRSVTPVILHGYNASRGQISRTKTEKLLWEAFTESGYPADTIRAFNMQPAPMISGTVGARDILVPAHLAKWPRYHVQVEFSAPIFGPVLVGIGRHYGIGLFAGES